MSATTVPNVKRVCQFLAGLALGVLFVASDAHGQTPTRGRLTYDRVSSPALAGNLLGDLAKRDVIVYLPPSYDRSPSKRYPVIYLLHGYPARALIWTDGTFQKLNIGLMMDSLIGVGAIREMLVVMPDAYNRYGGSHYVNSSVTGNWADFVTRDLVAYIDSTYRTIATAASRGLAGHSMGGRGTLFLALTHPGIYQAAYALSAGMMALDAYDPFENRLWTAALSLKKAPQPGDAALRPLSVAAAYSPNPGRRPLFVDFPVELRDGQITRVDSTWKKWLAHDPVAIADSLAENLRGLRALRFDCGRADAPPILDANRMLARKLAAKGVPHFFEEYEGDHLSGIRERIVTRVLPFFSGNLEFQ